MPDDPKLRTAYIFRTERRSRTGVAIGRWLECGVARDDDGTFHIFLDRLPVGGFSGRITVPPFGGKPPAVEPQIPKRAQPHDNHEEDEAD